MYLKIDLPLISFEKIKLFLLKTKQGKSLYKLNSFVSVGIGVRPRGDNIYIKSFLSFLFFQILLLLRILINFWKFYLNNLLFDFFLYIDYNSITLFLLILLLDKHHH